MCGFAGFLDYSHRGTSNHLQRMTDVIAYRGPDDQGHLFEEFNQATLGFGHRRLSILDLSPLGHQPYSFEHITVIFNGEIYNFMEIRSELEQKGYSFKSHSDTEVLIKAYHAEGIGCVRKFIGMFAFALLDRKSGKLYLVRDRAGVKPVHYTWMNNAFIFGSELKSLIEHPSFKKELDFTSLGNYFQYSYIPSPGTIYKDVYKLRPGHILEFDTDKKTITVNPYWDVFDFYNKPKLTISYDEALVHLRGLLKSACEYRMVSDVPVGVFLSGGYDSTAVAAILQHGRTEKLKTFTIGFEEAAYNEAGYAKKVADHLGTDHTEYFCTHKEAFDIIPGLPTTYDEPFGDNSIIPTTLVSKVAIQKVKVALSADGGDEIFGGYPKFGMSMKYTGYPDWLLGSLGAGMSLVNPDLIPFTGSSFNFTTRYRKIAQIFREHDPVKAMKVISQFNTDSELKKRFTFEFNPGRTDFDAGNQLGSQNDAVNKMLAIDYRTFLLDNNLTKVDRATMSVSLEGREPLLDHRIIEWAAQLPSEYKIRDGRGKAILKDIVHSYVPTSIMERPKMGFIVPIMGWFRNELKGMIHDYMNDDRLKKEGIFQVKEVAAIRDRYLSGKSENVQKIWHLLVFQLWKERWMP